MSLLKLARSIGAMESFAALYDSIKNDDAPDLPDTLAATTLEGAFDALVEHEKAVNEQEVMTMSMMFAGQDMFSAILASEAVFPDALANRWQKIMRQYDADNGIIALEAVDPLAVPDYPKNLPGPAEDDQQAPKDDNKDDDEDDDEDDSTLDQRTGFRE